MSEEVAAVMTKEFEIPKECKAGVVYNAGPDFEVKVEMVPVPQPGPNDVLIKLNCTGICYSDIHYMLNDLGLPPMSAFGVRSPGHEGAGIVVKVGEHVKNFKVGDRAGIKPLWDVCQSCELCWAGRENYCLKGTQAGLMVPGTYQQYLVSPAKYASPIPDGVPDIVAAPIMCSASTMIRAITDAALPPGAWAVFPGGGGGVGIQGVQLAKAMGFRPLAIDTGDAKRQLALDMGAEAFVDFKSTKDVPAEVKRITDGVGAHGVFVTAPGAYTNATRLLGDRVDGVVMCIGLPPAGSTFIHEEPRWFLGRARRVTGTLVGTLEDTHRALDYAKRGLLKQICEVYPIDKLPEAVERLRKGEVAGRLVVDFNQYSNTSSQLVDKINGDDSPLQTKLGTVYHNGHRL